MYESMCVCIGRTCAGVTLEMFLGSATFAIANTISLSGLIRAIDDLCVCVCVCGVCVCVDVYVYVYVLSTISLSGLIHAIDDLYI